MGALSFRTSPFQRQPGKAGMGRATSFWKAIGIMVFAILLAKWTWVFLAPAEIAMPATISWKKTDAADHLFGNEPATSGVAASSSLSNIKLIGVFAHPTEGFAVLSVDGKQVGTGLGELAAPGVRLIETHADHVLLENGATKVRIDLPAANAATGISTVSGTRDNPPAIANMAELQTQTSPEQRAAMQQELDHLRRRH